MSAPESGKSTNWVYVVNSSDDEENSSDDEYECHADSDSDCQSLKNKFDEKYSEYYYYKKEEEKDGDKGSTTQEEEKGGAKSGPGESSTVVQDAAEAKPKDPYEGLWRNWALENIQNARDHIEEYNKAKVPFYVHVAGFYGKNGGSGIGVLIRERQGIPVLAYSSKNTDRVSPFYQEMLAAEKGIELATKLGIKYIDMHCTSNDASFAISNCDRGGPCQGDGDMVYNLSWRIVNMLETRRCDVQKDCQDQGFTFTILPCGKLQNIPARYLARLQLDEEEMGPEELREQKDLMHFIYKDGNDLSDVYLFS